MRSKTFLGEPLLAGAASVKADVVVERVDTTERLYARRGVGIAVPSVGPIASTRLAAPPHGL
jgi:hypothetical protein